MIQGVHPSSTPPHGGYDPGDRWVPVDRRRLGLDGATFLPAFVVLALAFVMGAVLPAINSAVAYDDRVVAGDVMAVAGDITFVPAAGWGITSGVRVGDAPATGYPRSARVEDGDLSFTVRTGDFSGDARALLQQIKDTTEALDENIRIDGAPVAITTDSGERGLVARYAGPKLDGALAAFVVEGRGIEVVAVGPPDTEHHQAEQIAQMISSIRHTEEGTR
ncbi:hypothetical protein [Rhodococcus sp. NPDC003348]